MDVVVCVKQVPETAEAEIKIAPNSKTIETAGLVYDINEWDVYALEEAVRIKEKFGGHVTVVTVGSEDVDSMLRKCLARGADRAVRVEYPNVSRLDPFLTAKILHGAIKEMHYDIILTGVQAGDDCYAITGPIIAEMLRIPHATMVKKIELESDVARVVRELEGGWEEILEVKLPALFTVQTGINEPRYISIMGIRRAMQKEITVKNLAEIGLSSADINEDNGWLYMDKLFIPPVERKVEFLRGSPDEVAAKLVEILRSRRII